MMNTFSLTNKSVRAGRYVRQLCSGSRCVSWLSHGIWGILMAVTITFTGINANAQSGDEAYYDAFMSVTDEVNLTQLREAGLVITARYDGIITAQVPQQYRPYELKSFAGVNHVSAAIPLLTYCDSARYYSRVDKVHRGEGLNLPYKGKDVIVGIIDCGFDFNHINFVDAEGNPRVKAVYMPFDNSGRTIMVNRIMLPGSCFETPERIKNLTTDDPKTTHGTQTAGIAAGSYDHNGWYGIAPEADIVICAMPEEKLNDVRLAHCISYINDYATRMGKPYVVNISMGNNVGPHDGSSFISSIFHQFAGPGKIFVVAAGNDGDQQVCIHEEIQSKNDTVTTLLSGYTGGLRRSGFVNAWSDQGKLFNSRLIVYDISTRKIVYRSRSLGATASGVVADFDTQTDAELAQYYTGRVLFSGSVELNGEGLSLMDIDMTARDPRYVMGFQYYSPMATKLNIWTSQYAYFNNYGQSWVSTGTPVGSISEIAANDSVISVGSYNTKQYVPLRDSTLYYRHFSKPFEMSYYSSYGPDENGIRRPDVCAPGSVVISSANRYDTNPPNIQFWQPSAFVDGVEYSYCPDLGTSMAAPVVAGAIALWLQANPTLSTADIRQVLNKTSIRDWYVATGNAERWGAGKLDINAGLRYVLHIEEKSGDVNQDGEVNLSDINVVIDIVLGGTADDDTRRLADVNNDGEVNLSDINEIIALIVG